jgi:hypothetical protein
MSDDPTPSGSEFYACPNEDCPSHAVPRELAMVADVDSLGRTRNRRPSGGDAACICGGCGARLEQVPGLEFSAAEQPVPPDRLAEEPAAAAGPPVGA